MVVGNVTADGTPNKPERKKDAQGNYIDAIEWDEQEANHQLHGWILAIEKDCDDWNPLNAEEILATVDDEEESEENENEGDEDSMPSLGLSDNEAENVSDEVSLPESSDTDWEDESDDSVRWYCVRF